MAQPKRHAYSRVSCWGLGPPLGGLPLPPCRAICCRDTCRQLRTGRRWWAGGDAHACCAGPCLWLGNVRTCSLPAFPWRPSPPDGEGRPALPCPAQRSQLSPSLWGGGSFPQHFLPLLLGFVCYFCACPEELECSWVAFGSPDFRQRSANSAAELRRGGRGRSLWASLLCCFVLNAPPPMTGHPPDLAKSCMGLGGSEGLCLHPPPPLQALTVSGPPLTGASVSLSGGGGVGGCLQLS